MKLALSYGQVKGMVKFLEASISMNNKQMDESDVSASVKSSRLHSILQSHARSSSFDIDD